MLLHPRWRGPYLGLLLVVTCLLSASALQAYRLQGGIRPWEPVLWEFSSVAVIGMLAPLLHGIVGWLRGRAWAWQLSAHGAAFVAFSLAHIAGMYGLRLSIYRLLGVDYQPYALGELLIHEGGKDAVSYVFIVLISRGIWLASDAAARQQALDRMQRELAEARLNRLTDLLQPHFLFNSLNLISSVMHEDVARADRLLCQLADLLRQTLGASQKLEHTVHEELALVEPFLALMQARFGSDRLAVEIDADASASRCLVPALLLLVPLENAVKHHVARQCGRVRVRVGVAAQGGRLELVVSNEGEGLLPPPAGEVESGLGLHNLRERLAARYGGAARLHFERLATGATLRLELPCGC